MPTIRCQTRARPKRDPFFAFVLCVILLLFKPGVSRADPPLAASSPLSQLPSDIKTIRCGSPLHPQVALTFDDGPTTKNTPAILDILRQYRVLGTFFMLGRLVRRYPALVHRVAAEGHLVANHSWSHLKRGNALFWQEEIQHTEAALVAAGVTPSPYFRPPHGIINPAIIETCTSLQRWIILYTVLSSDWQQSNAEALTRQVVGRSHPGGIIVLHDGGGNRHQTIAALPTIILGLRKKGLEPVRLDTLLGPNPQAVRCANGRSENSARSRKRGRKIEPTMQNN